MELPFVFGHNRGMMNTAFTCRASQWSMRKMTNYYKVLDLDSENAGIDEIKRAYRSMALRCHPDACSSSRREESTRMFVELSRAYRTLRDPVMRERHDRQLGLVGWGDGEEIEGMWRRGGTRFTREVWMSQIHGLEARSIKRMMKKRNMSCV